MARIAGINIPDNKHICISLTHIYGIGRASADQICKTLNIEPSTKVGEIGSDVLERIRERMTQYTTEGDLRREVSINIKRLKDLGCNRGIRHRRGLPVRGQRTRTNARTRKGPRRLIKK